MMNQNFECNVDHIYSYPTKYIFNFIQHVNRGKLLNTAYDVFKIVQIAEKEFRLRVILGGQMNARNLDKFIVQSVIMKFYSQ